MQFAFKSPVGGNIALDVIDGRGISDQVYQLEGREQLPVFKRIATLQELDIERPLDRPTDWRGGAAAARERGMNRLADRLERLAA